MLGELFDPKGELLIYEHCRPHWSQAGAVVFITFRTHDSIPREVIDRWERAKQEWLRSHGHSTVPTRSGAMGATGVSAHSPVRHWSEVVPTLAEQEQRAFRKQFDRCREEFLDTCHGRCMLRRPELATIVADSLMHFHGDRYRMGDFVVMPNHVHLMAVFGSAEVLKDQCDSWLHFTAFKINKEIGEKGKFWQQEPFDHLVRSPEQYHYLRKYIADNPHKAGLKSGEYYYRRFNG